MPDTVMPEPCPHCGDVLERTTLLWPDPEAERQLGGEILIERPGVWCPACDCAVPDALEPADAPAPARRAA